MFRNWFIAFFFDRKSFLFSPGQTLKVFGEINRSFSPKCRLICFETNFIARLSTMPTKNAKDDKSCSSFGFMRV